jgi:hypothetical protein
MQVSHVLGRNKTMNNISILDQIINTNIADEVNSLNAVDIINNLFNELSDREKDVLIRRHGLHTSKKETLESIGNAHKLTRERIRQIETFSVKKLQQLEKLSEYVDNLRKVILQLLESHGGLMEKDYLLDILTSFSSFGADSKEYDESVHKNYLNFMITKLLHDEFEEANNHKHFKKLYKLRYQDLNHFEEIVNELHGAVSKEDKIYKTEEIIDLIKEFDSYQKHANRLDIKSENLDVAKVFKKGLFSENINIVNDNKPTFSILKAAKKVEQNKFGHWGVHNSREIKPKTINDKIYLVLKNEKKPIHFSEISEIINKIKFDGKIANPATVHNELILDKKYVLVGRGLYGLREWGFKKGTVLDVIVDILSGNEEPMSREEIIHKVLDKRMVKKATIILALMNKNKFNKVSGKYILS